MAEIPSITDVQAAFSEGVRGRGSKWEGRTTAAATTWEERAKSSEAEENYRIGTERAIQRGLRLRGLQPVSATDFQTSIRGMGRIWEDKATARAPKYGQKFAPYLNEIARIVPTLPPKIPGAARENVINRVVPIAEGLQQLKLAGASPLPAYHSPSPLPAYASPSPPPAYHSPASPAQREYFYR